MIDDKFLDNVVIADTWSGKGRTWTLGPLTEDEADEIKKLARLGLWARKDGIPTLRWHARREAIIPERQSPCKQALAALPKDEQ
jgi:hypothetical protein